MASIGDIVRDAALKFRLAGLPTPDLDARLLLMAAGRLTAAQVISGNRSTLAASAEEKFDDYVKRRLAREPVHRITASREFFGRPFGLGPQTLVPRPDTELLVEVMIGTFEQDHRGVKILELGTGSGVIAVTLAAELPDAQLVAVDISKEAIEIAHTNASFHSVQDRIKFVTGDLFEPVDGRFQAIVSNPPYIKSGDIQSLDEEVRCHDPHVALDGGSDGLEFYRRIFARACAYLEEDGLVAVEIGHEQADSVFAIAECEGFTALQVYRDLAGLDRVVTARKCCKNA